ncbi:unnamed protein product [Schistosoma mattheei]|uniref:Uncharacterized protein n=1 Tax=Schistosoma mattheei TaxID=31246 RepID=A0A3P8JS43_9TREM|nr:unnamed protein product [Schistosoma mattheei]
MTYAPEEPAPQPSAVVLKEFIMSPGTLRLEVSLNKEVGSCFTGFKLFLFIWINQFALNTFIPDFKISKNL